MGSSYDRHSPAAFRGATIVNIGPSTGPHRGEGAGHGARLAGAPAVAASRPGVVALRKILDAPGRSLPAAPPSETVIGASGARRVGAGSDSGSSGARVIGKRSTRRTATGSSTARGRPSSREAVDVTTTGVVEGDGRRRHRRRSGRRRRAALSVGDGVGRDPARQALGDLIVEQQILDTTNFRSNGIPTRGSTASSSSPTHLYALTRPRRIVQADPREGLRRRRARRWTSACGPSYSPR